MIFCENNREVLRDKILAEKTILIYCIGNDAHFTASVFHILCHGYETEKLVVLDVKEQTYFKATGYTDQHMGGQAFAHDETIMGWLFGEHP